MLKCPRCGKELATNLNSYQTKETDYVEVEFICENNHEFFTRIKKDDLIEG